MCNMIDHLGLLQLLATMRNAPSLPHVGKQLEPLQFLGMLSQPLNKS